MMNIRRCGWLIVLLLAFPVTGKTQNNSDSNGALVVFVTLGDLDNTPAANVFIEAHSVGSEHGSEKPFVLKMSHEGRYAAPLAPGVYDVFASEGDSQPACKRVLIKTGSTTQWTLKMKVDYVYTDK